MGIEKSFRNSPEILKIEDFTLKYHRSFDTIILTFQSKVLKGLISQNLVKPLDLEFGSSHSKFPIYEVTNNPEVVFYLCPIGAPTTVGALEELVYSLDLKNIILYGSCGVLDKKITAGKVIVPTKAYRDEGTSYHYAKASDFIDIENHEIISNVLKKLQVDYVKGYTWTTDAFYRETEALFAERKTQGCIAVEMEISAVQAFANLRDVNLYAFIYSADNLDASKWDRRILSNLKLDKRIEFFLLALEIAKGIK